MHTIENGVKPSSELFFASPSNQAKNLFYYVTCTGHYQYEDSYQLYRDNYNSFLLMHIIKGSVKIEYENISFIARMGETVLIDCHKPHSYSSMGYLDTIWFHFDGGNSNAMYQELSTLYHSMIVAKNSSEIVNRIYKIYEIYKSGKKVSEAIQSALIARIFGEFFQLPSGETLDKDSIMNRVINHIEENYNKELTVDELSQLAGLSEYYFSRLFKKQTAYSIHEYIIKTRIINAKILLKSTDLSLREIAYQCGFTNESSFSNTFKKNTGMTPGMFRATEIG
jgi:AraC-like DNA-binding protein